jgi:hypothetical protein
MALRVLSAAERVGDKDLALHGHCQVAIPEAFLGEFAGSLAHCEAAQALYDPKRHHASVSTLAGDAGVVALVYAALNLWQLGWPDRGLARAREAVALARRLNDPFNLAHALFFEATLHWLRRDATAQRQRAAETIALSEAQGFPLWLALGRTFEAAARAVGGEPGAVADVLAGLALAAGTGSQAGAPTLFALLGEAQLAAGLLAEARGAVEMGLSLAAQTGQRIYDAELHRLQGEIVRAAGGSPALAEARFHGALEIARAQEGKSAELRAATSLARLWRDEGKRDEARELLAPLYAWFSEGFDTGDLVAARRLLEELDSNG